MSKTPPDDEMVELDALARTANALRKAGDVESAQRGFDKVLAVLPNHPAALHGRARLALARGEADAVARFDAALRMRSGDADLWLGKAQALNLAGDIKGALLVAQQLCEQAPGLIEALEFLAGLRLAQGETDYARGFRAAASRAPQDPNIAAAHVDALAGLDHALAAADIAAEARLRFPGEQHFTLLEAINASAGGQWDRADALFASLDSGQPAYFLHEARHALRASDTARTQTLLDKAIAHQPWDIAAWALQGIVWRLEKDARNAWLHEQSGLVQMRPLMGRDGLVDDVSAQLRIVHRHSAMPLGQSLRGGTQTHGVLFHRKDPILAELREAIQATLAEYRAALPPFDATHPLLRCGDENWGLAGSWSVRLCAGSGDHHTAHIHPEGLISSALYCVTPDASADQNARQGWLELGRAPKDLGLDLGPMTALEPQEGHLALFPSTLYHGTTAFIGCEAQERLAVAFDVVPVL